jgi:SAM-dependent methyltransferase
LRRVDRWIANLAVLRRTSDPLVVDLGYGASGVTSFELERRLRRVQPDVFVLGLEIEPDRVAVAKRQLESVRGRETTFAADAHVEFTRGGFEVPIPDARLATIIRAFNVLRQYDESEVASAWQLMLTRLQPDGVLVEGTCDEIGRVSTWIDLTRDGPQSLTVSLRLAGLEMPSIAAERLPKALIHHNVPGEKVHAFFDELDRQWRNAAALANYGPTQRWIAAVEGLREAGWPILTGRTRWRLGEVTVSWDSVAPHRFQA